MWSLKDLHGISHVAGAAALTYYLIWSRTNQKPSPQLVKEVLLKGSVQSDDLEKFYRSGRRLDLMSLAEKINDLYPADPHTLTHSIANALESSSMLGIL